MFGSLNTISPTTGIYESYLWQDQSSNTSFTVWAAGNYWLTVNDGCGNSAVDSVIIVDCPTSIEENEGETFSIYPNPNNGNFTIELSKKNVNATIEIFNSIGKLIWKKQLFKKLNKIDLDNISTGIYFIKVTNGFSYVIKKVIID